MIISVVYLLLCRLLDSFVVLARREVSKDADRSAGSAASQPTGCGSRYCREWFLAAGRVRCLR